MHPHFSHLAPLVQLLQCLQAEPELFGHLETGAATVSGELARQHPMAWRCLAEGEGVEAVEALTLVAPSPAEVDDLPDWRDAGWSVSAHEPLPGQHLTLWWHAASQQAMLASCIPLGELRHDAVARTLRLHAEGLSLCQQLAQQAWAQARPHGAITLSPFA